MVKDHVVETSGELILCGTPIGNMGDASPRLSEALESADVVAAEDTRRTKRLLDSLGIVNKPRLISCYDATEKVRADQLVEQARLGAKIVLVTDAGMPAVSDPGFRVVAAFVAAELPVTVVPGPSSVTSAIALSGLPSDRWCMEGFLSRTGGERRKQLAALVKERRTMVFLEAPHRAKAMLADAAAAFGEDRLAVICREITKLHEETIRGSLRELADWAADNEPRGEFTIVIAGAPAEEQRSYTPSELAQMAAATGLRGKEAVAEVAKQTGVAKRDVYAAVIDGKTAGANH